MGKRFHPPNKGMLPNERVVWSSEKGGGFALIILAFILAFCAVFLMFIFIGGGVSGGVNVVVQYAIIIFFLVGTSLWVFIYIVGKITRFYLTNKRVLKTRLGRILQEVPLSKYEDVGDLSHFVDSKSAGHYNGQQRFSLKVYDPDSWEPVIDCKLATKEMIEKFRLIGSVIRCVYCDTRNPAVDNRCSYCGASL